MQLRLTRNLAKIALLFSLSSGLAVQAAEQVASLAGEESARYLQQLRSLYMTSDDRKALLEHSNALLQAYALRAGYQIGAQQPKDVLYRLSVAAPGELMVREEIRSDGRLEVRNRPVAIYGVDPFIRYECPQVGITCDIKHPADGSPWLLMVRDHQGAADLAKALSFLIRNLQKG